MPTPLHRDRIRTHLENVDLLLSSSRKKLEQLAFTLDEEEDVTIEKVTKKFYERFKKEHHVFLKTGISLQDDRAG